MIGKLSSHKSPVLEENNQVSRLHFVVQYLEESPPEVIFWVYHLIDTCVHLECTEEHQ